MIWLQRLLLTVGLLSVGYCVGAWGETTLYQAFENRELDAILATAPASGTRTAGTPVARVSARGEGTVLGRIEIPRLEVSAVVRTGSDARTLQLAVGHIPGTALPGEAGNVGLAGHRDTFFRRLRGIRHGDAIRITTADGVYRYAVQETRIVEPDAVEVLDPTDRPSLTLVTCYPFSYIGSAPQRFIVRAELLEERAAN